ncbi:hypothetical protein N7532_006789 [Penicillium argentinense]|uniref:Wax synthase domain-containing protein n=1 Tax=Penicillium argentinense TaxID=1131581 RepID=A0A9W9FGH2_9EURO|nr:uncharacterized protein N7532_006789 [Penicillium argentinense]KAJ5099788.1 hypothetical protein N7532_006789 [Penicillium argentinense]
MADLHYEELVRFRERQLESLLIEGVYKPILVHHLVLLNLLPLIGLLIPRHSARYVRPSIFALSLGLAWQALRSHRAILGGNGYMIGLMTAWWLVSSAGLLVFTDIEQDCRRIERGPATTGKRKDEQGARFHWQSYPHRFSHRLEWCAGLLFNLRGPEWNWRAPHLGPLPRSVHHELHAGFTSDKFQAEDDATYPSSKARLKQAFRTCLISYLLLDTLKVVMMRDPYFRGTATADSLPPFPFSYLESIPLANRFYRVFLSAMGVYVALNFVTSFNPIVFLGLSMAFPNASRSLTAAPLDASWLYADSFGFFCEPIADHGLAGCWGRWWHQLFRNGFTVTANWILNFLPNSVRRKPVERCVHVIVAFFLSGFIHACGSYTQLPETKPLSGPFLFFAMQSVAVIGEYIFKTIVFPKLPLSNTPKWLRRTANIALTFSWLLFSGAWIADDFARGGLWLVQPIPASPLGFVTGNDFWVWKEPWFQSTSGGYRVI